MPATLASLVGLERNPEMPEDSQDQLNAWLGMELSGRDYVIGSAGSITVLTREWKYIEPSDRLVYNVNTNIEFGNNPEEQLYNMIIDRGEYENVADENPERLELMKFILEKEKAKGIDMDL